MKPNVILHDLTGSHLVLAQGREDQLLQLPFLTKNGKIEDESAFNFYHQICAKPDDYLLEPPMFTRYCIRDEEDVEVAVVFELQCRRCTIALKAEYAWTQITPALLQRIKDSYPPLVWRAICNIADETLENSANDSVPVFAKRGFLTRERNTIKSRLKQCGRETECCLELRTTTETSAVFSLIFTEGPRLYYKISERSRSEALFTQTLARLLPDLVVTPFGVDVAENSFFTEDFGETAGDCTRNDNYDQEKVEKHILQPSIESIFEFHKRAAKHVDELRQLGIEDVSPQQMKIELPDFVSQVEEMGILTEADAQLMRERLPSIFTDLDGLIDGNIPLTICHGDLHFDNIRHPPSVNELPLLFDWYESVISHPFLDILVGNFWMAPWFDVYLQKWTSYGSTSHIYGLFENAASVHRLWRTFQRFKNIVNRDNQLGIGKNLRYCRDMLKLFIESNLRDDKPN